MIDLITYVGRCCREWTMLAMHKPGRCGYCGERPQFVRMGKAGDGQ